MTRTFVLLIVFTSLLYTSQAYFQDQQHREKAKNLLNNFVSEFTNRYKAISLDGIDFMEAMELGMGYWITRVRIHSFEHIQMEYDVNHDILEFTAPEFHVDLVIDNKYTVPIKIEKFYMAIIFNVSPTYFRCTEVELDYGAVSLDWNSVVEYLSKQFLSSEMIKSALKQGELPLRNLFAQTLRNNHQRLNALLTQLKETDIDLKGLFDQLEEVKHTTIDEQEFIFYLKDIFGFESVKDKKKQDL